MLGADFLLRPSVKGKEKLPDHNSSRVQLLPARSFWFVFRSQRTNRMNSKQAGFPGRRRTVAVMDAIHFISRCF